MPEEQAAIATIKAERAAGQTIRGIQARLVLQGIELSRGAVHRIATEIAAPALHAG